MKEVYGGERKIGRTDGYDGMGLSEMGLVEWLNGYVEVSERKGGAAKRGEYRCGHEGYDMDCEKVGVMMDIMGMGNMMNVGLCVWVQWALKMWVSMW